MSKKIMQELSVFTVKTIFATETIVIKNGMKGNVVIR